MKYLILGLLLSNLCFANLFDPPKPDKYVEEVSICEQVHKFYKDKENNICFIRSGGMTQYGGFSFITFIDCKIVDKCKLKKESNKEPKKCQ